MDFTVQKDDLNRALRQILLGRSADSSDIVDFTVEGSVLTLVVTGRSVGVTVEAQKGGSSSIPIAVIFGLKRVIRTYKDEAFRFRIDEGRLRLQNTSISHPGIVMRKVAKRVVDIPEDALPRDILSLTSILSLDEIEDCGLHAKLLEAQKKMAEDIDRAYSLLCTYGFDRSELSTMAKLKIESHADAMRKVLFSGN